MTASILWNPVSPELNVFSRTVSSSCLYFAKPLLSTACELAIVVMLVQDKYGQTCTRQKLLQCFISLMPVWPNMPRGTKPGLCTQICSHMVTCQWMSRRRRTGSCNALSHLTDCPMGWPQFAIWSDLTPEECFESFLHCKCSQSQEPFEFLRP